MKVALLCDVDQTVYHVGDEAIATMSERRLRERGHEVVRLSRHEKYGPGGSAPRESIPALVFPWSLEGRTRYLEEIRRVLAGDLDALPREDKLFGIIERLREVGAVVIGGGGSLNSRYGWLLAERLATALVARSLGKQVVLTGQSLGPELTPTDRESLRELLELCSLAGLRDVHSLRLARQLCPEHPALVQTLDDAVGLGVAEGADAPDPGGAEGADAPDPGLLSVTLGGDGDPLPREDYIAVACAVIETLVDRTGARVELVAHMADPDEGGGDLALHSEVAERLQVPSVVLPIERDTEAAARTARAGWVLTTRFHPVVFGTTAGSAVLALPLNRYGHSRMDGALRNVGLAGAAVPAAALWDPTTAGPSALVALVVDALVAGREAEAAHLQEVRPQLLAAAEAWWDRVTEQLTDPAESAGKGPAGLKDPRGAGLPVHQRWEESLRERLAPWTRHGELPAGTEAPAAAIILRTRDRSTMLDRALQDVLAQTRQDWELVIVNDAGERDPVEQVLARHRDEADGRIQVLHRGRAAGMEAASNHGLRETTAPAVAIHDDDDSWHATFLQETLAHLEAHPAQEAVVVRTLIVHERETPAGFVEERAFPFWGELEGVRLIDYIAVNRNVPISMLHRRRVHDLVGEYDESLPVVGDYAFHLELLQRVEVGFLQRPLARWHQRPSAVGTSSNSMFAQSHGHRHFDAELRERHFRRWTAENGIGLPLFLSRDTRTTVALSEERLLGELRSLREELATLHARMDRIDRAHAAQRPAGLVERVGRRALREGRRLLRPRRSE